MFDLHLDAFHKGIIVFYNAVKLHKSHGRTYIFGQVPDMCQDNFIIFCSFQRNQDLFIHIASLYLNNMKAKPSSG
jgi:hypothetical protein